MQICVVFEAMFENSDDYDFSPAESSKLASLFGTSALSDSSFNSSLKYTAPKQPSPSNSKENESLKTKPKPQTRVVLAKVVTLWKLENKEYKALGKHGLAIIGSEDLKIHEIIAYKEKNNVILKTKLTSDFQFHIQKDNFSSFYDNDSNNWLIKFDNEDQKEFSNVIEKCGAQTVPSIDQDSEKINEPSAKPDLLPKQTKIAETKTDDHSDSSGSLKRSNILNRMARMGQQILPRNSVRNTSTDISDTEPEEDKNERKFTRKLKHTMPERILPKKSPDIEKQIVPVSDFSVENTPSAFTPSVNSDILSHYILSQNTELKMHLAQMTAKLDSFFMGNSKTPSTPPDTMAQSKIKALQLKLENLEAYLKDYEKKYMRLEIKYEDLGRKDNDKSEKLEEELSVLRRQLFELEKQLEGFEAMKKSLEHCERCIDVKNKQIEDQKHELQKLKELNVGSENQQATIDSLNKIIDELKEKLRASEEHEVRIEKQKTEETVGLRSNTIKTNMNEMYTSILENLDRDKTYSYAEVQNTVARYLKRTTFKIIEDLSGIDKSNVVLDTENVKLEN
ncbi:unnamed protein product [Phaedon cochleariae]|uniref:Uncharacterized protein n=1 Tax=Phaedon cochleariae TaxID=80249 RepID=A0A9P0GSQ0_PHACE|nr:unnamed protein product [Phaedon cochleariae]